MMRQLLIITGIILAACGKRVTSVNSSKEQGIISTISSRKTTYNSGETPEINVSIKNNTGSTILLVRSLDGSGEKMRYPHAYFKIEKLKDTAYKPTPVLRCGNMNTIRPADFVTVRPGSIFNPYDPQEYTFPDFRITDTSNFTLPGKYKVTFYYSTNEPDFEKWLGDLLPEYTDPETGQLQTENPEYQKLLALFRKVPKVEIASNDLIIEIK